MKGASRLSKSYSNKSLNNAMSLISGAVGRLLGSSVNNNSTANTADGDNSSSPSGHAMSLVRILLNISSGVSPVKGGIPVMNSYKQTPNAHQSTPKPCPFLSSSSGAR